MIEEVQVMEPRSAAGRSATCDLRNSLPHNQQSTDGADESCAGQSLSSEVTVSDLSSLADPRPSSEAAVRSDSLPVPPIRVLLADDHRILREGLASLLSEEPDLLVVGQAGDGMEAIELTRHTRPDVVLMDVTMPRLDGIAATRRITAEMSKVAVIGLSMHEEDDMADAMRAAGAVAYLSKGGPSEALIAAIRNCMA